MKKISPVALSGLFYILLSVWAFFQALAQTNGQQLFVLDDPYIHASIARGLLQYGELTVSTSGFSSASSSIIWPILVAFCAHFVGLHLWLLLALNALFALLVLWVADKILVDLSGEGTPWLRLLLLCLIVLGGSLVELTFIGMEHNLQVLTILFLFRYALKVVRGVKGSEWLLCLSGMAASLVRYEAAFAIIVVAGLLLYHRRFLLAGAFAVLSSLPVVFFGIYAISRGASMLPNSLLMKASVGHWWQPAASGLSFATQYAKFVVIEGGTLVAFCILILAADFLLRKTIVSNKEVREFLLITLALMLLHYNLARTGWAARYEAYLIVLVTLAIGVVALSAKPVQSSRILAHPTRVGLLVLIVLLAPRIWWSERIVTHAARGIYLQQMQMARFLGKFYPAQPVVLGDIGVVSYWQPRTIIDVNGLASTEITRLKMKGEFNTTTLDRMVAREGAQVAIIYSQGPGDKSIPADWTLIGSWTIPGAKAPGETIGAQTVYFYALKEEENVKLQQALSSYASCLPKEIQQVGYSVQAQSPCTIPAAPDGWIW